MLGRLTRETVNELADITAESLGWSIEQKAAEVQRTLQLLSDRHGVQF
jgi:hypothetical protein